MEANTEEFCSFYKHKTILCSATQWEKRKNFCEAIGGRLQDGTSILHWLVCAKCCTDVDQMQARQWWCMTRGHTIRDLRTYNASGIKRLHDANPMLQFEGPYAQAEVIRLPPSLQYIAVMGDTVSKQFMFYDLPKPEEKKKKLSEIEDVVLDHIVTTNGINPQRAIDMITPHEESYELEIVGMPINQALKLGPIALAQEKARQEAEDAKAKAREELLSSAAYRERQRALLAEYQARLKNKKTKAEMRRRDLGGLVMVPKGRVVESKTVSDFTLSYARDPLNE